MFMFRPEHELKLLRNREREMKASRNFRNLSIHKASSSSNDILSDEKLASNEPKDWPTFCPVIDNSGLHVVTDSLTQETTQRYNTLDMVWNLYRDQVLTTFQVKQIFLEMCCCVVTEFVSVTPGQERIEKILAIYDHHTGFSR